MKTKTYTKHKKNTKKPDITGAEWKMLEEIGQYKTESQLDRIERKLDELLKRQPTINITQPGTWTMPCPYPTIAPEQPTHTPVDHYGNPTIYCSSNGDAR